MGAITADWENRRNSGSDPAIAAYLDQIGRYPLLSPFAEKQLIQELVQQREKAGQFFFQSEYGIAVIAECRTDWLAGNTEAWFDVAVTDRVTHERFRTDLEAALAHDPQEAGDLLGSLPLKRQKIEEAIQQWGIALAADRSRSTAEVIRYCRAQSACKRHQATRQHLVESNLRLVVTIAKQFARNSDSLLDTIQEGNCGLMRAIDKINANQDVRLCTYASYWIRQAIQRTKCRSHPVWLPSDRVSTVRKLEEAIEEIIQAEQRPASLEKAADKLGLGENEARLLLAAGRSTLSLQGIGSDDCLDLVSRGSDESPESRDVSAHRSRCVRRALESLDKQEAQVIRLRYGFDENLGEASFRKVGERLNVSREWVRKLEKRAVAKLRRDPLYSAAAHLEL